MQCTSPMQLGYNEKLNKWLEVPCGKCIACKIRKSREWALRVVHELGYWEKSCFVTLTYANEHLVENASTSKTEFRLFLKRLRKKLSQQKRSMKIYGCSEYGDQTFRPHYHLILFGVGMDEKNLIEEAWTSKNPDTGITHTLGMVHVGSVTFDSARYVAQYIDKKYTGNLADTTYTQKGREPPTQFASQGIGKQFCIDNAQTLREDRQTTLQGVPVGLPRYYVKLLGLTPEDLQSTSLAIQDKSIKKYVAYRNQHPEANRTFGGYKANIKKQSEATLKGKIANNKARKKKI